MCYAPNKYFRKLTMVILMVIILVTNAVGLFSLVSPKIKSIGVRMREIYAAFSSPPKGLLSGSVACYISTNKAGR